MRYRWNPPPYWPAFAEDFQPSPAWRPEPEWAPPPVGWSFWTWPNGRPAPGPARRYGAGRGPIATVRRHKAASAVGGAALTVLALVQLPGTGSDGDLAVASVANRTPDGRTSEPADGSRWEEPRLFRTTTPAAPPAAPAPELAAPVIPDAVAEPLRRILRPRTTLAPTRRPTVAGSTTRTSTGGTAVTPVPEPGPVVPPPADPSPPSPPPVVPPPVEPPPPPPPPPPVDPPVDPPPPPPPPVDPPPPPVDPPPPPPDPPDPPAP